MDEWVVWFVHLSSHSKVYVKLIELISYSAFLLSGLNGIDI